MTDVDPLDERGDREIERLLTAERTTVDIVDDGETVFEADPTQFEVGKVTARRISDRGRTVDIKATIYLPMPDNFETETNDE